VILACKKATLVTIYKYQTQLELLHHVYIGFTIMLVYIVL